MKDERKEGIISGKAGEQVEIPFSNQVLDFLAELSCLIRNDRELGRDEEIRAFGFWCRRANLERLKEKYSGNGVRLGRGLVFHITPSNIQTMFAWSMAIGLLAGNSNIIRISSRLSGTGFKLKALIEDTFASSGEKETVGNMVRFVSYDSRDKERTEYFSSRCDTRIIWGGDRTMEEIRKIPLKAGAGEIAFPDRTSILLLNTDEISKLGEEELENLAHRFCMDTYNMDQNACSSPSLVFWEDGTDENVSDENVSGYAGTQINSRAGQVRKRWWTAVEKAAADYELTAHKVAGKFGALCTAAMAHNNLGEMSRYGNLIWVVPVKSITEGASGLKGKFGLFYEYRIETLEELIPVITEKIQTMTFYGYQKERLQSFIRDQRLRGIDRVVPAGQALAMDLTWDGMNLIERLSREIT
ncbi:acyl-CoA reductase [Clostridium transplantifaecale]|uniref:acyl-CoA reductase n=1 Tax=Clostridium transplantifaecale TaxID=2479838 RepID=UPI000F63069E|nr:acyl-CoA reductase [Clostridium transplantifaecale]